MAEPCKECLVSALTCGCYDDASFDFHMRTKRTILGTCRMNWVLDHFTSLPTGSIKGREFQPYQNNTCHLELEISADDLRVYLCFQTNNHLVCCDFSVSDVNGQILYENSSKSNCAERFDLTDARMRSCYPKIKSAVNDRIIIICFIKIHGSVSTSLFDIKSINNHNELYSLRKLSEDLKYVLKNSVNTDLILSVENERLPVHKAILCARSPVFAGMFQNEMSECKKNLVDIVDVDMETLKKLIDFLYSGQFFLSDSLDSICKLYYSADKYEILDLRRMCGDALVTKLTTENACRILALADQHNDEPTKLKIIKFICCHLNTIIETDCWNTYMNNSLSAEVIRQSSDLIKNE